MKETESEEIERDRDLKNCHVRPKTRQQAREKEREKEIKREKTLIFTNLKK